MDEHMLIEFLVNRTQGMDRLAGQTLNVWALAVERQGSETVRTEALHGQYVQFKAQADAYFDVLRFLVTFECKHVTKCDCAVGGLR